MRLCIECNGFKGKCVVRELQIPQNNRLDSSTVTSEASMDDATVSTPEFSYFASRDNMKTAEKDDMRFQNDSSVEFWRNWRDPYSNAPDLQSAFNAFRERLQNSGALDSVQGASYWGYHLARIMFFVVNGAVGALGTSSLSLSLLLASLSLLTHTCPNTSANTYARVYRLWH